MYNFPFADFNQINEKLNTNDSKSRDKLSLVHEAIGGTFHDEHKQVMTGAQVAIVSIGGLAIEIKGKTVSLLETYLSKEELIDSLKKTIGMSSFMSYLNPKNKSLAELAQHTCDIGHQSVLHTVSVGILITGITSGVEHEFSSQRDIVHLSRITVARTRAQSSPCLVLPDSQYLSVYKEVLESTQAILAKNEIDNLEIRNLLFPAAKASGLLINGSLRNLLKLIELKNSDGKEEEFVTALKKIEAAILYAFGDLLRKSQS